MGSSMPKNDVFFLSLSSKLERPQTISVVQIIACKTKTNQNLIFGAPFSPGGQKMRVSFKSKG